MPKLIEDLTVLGCLRLPRHTISTLPMPEEGGVIYVSDNYDGPGLAYSDGINWRRVKDNLIIM